MTFAQHDAAHRDKRRGCKTEFFCAEQRGDYYVATGLQLAVGLHPDAAAKVVHQQDLLGFSKAKLPWNSRVLDRTEWRCAGATTVSGDKDYIGMSFGDTGSHGSDANLRHQ